MNTESINTAIILQDGFIEEMPFVNDECGDTLWDNVLNITEGKLKEV